MADTIRADFADATCSDCGTKGCCIKHWGPLVPSGKTGQFCGECWNARVDHYEKTGKAKPIEEREPSGG